MRRRTLLVAFTVVAAIAGASVLRAGWTSGGAFPHAVHAGLFPVCTGCHAGAAPGAKDAALYPGKEVCASCHDGKRQDPVDWTAPRAHGSNLRFSHSDHAAGLVDAGLTADCARCHTPSGATTTKAAMIALTGAKPEVCLGCHEHQAPAHLAESARCRTCHVSLARATKLDSARLAALPMPPGHDAADFVLRHGPTEGVAKARCAICHTQESCTRCHMNAATVPPIAALESNARMVLAARGKPAKYPLPANHDASWDASHGATARSAIQSCANCHAQQGCRGCHIGEGAQQQIARLPVATPGGPQGALAVASTKPAVSAKATPAGPSAPRALAFTAPTRNRAHPTGFAEAHGTAAASGSSTCTGCHARSFCSGCHAGSSKPVFHPANFMLRHAADAYGGSKNCGSCHNTESFCKSCHRGAGLTARGRIDVAFHTGQPLWLLQHGEAARKGLEGCTSCHRQQDCTRCHSASGGWGVNPHGPGFDAARASDRNQLVCARCHVSTPRASTR